MYRYEDYLKGRKVYQESGVQLLLEMKHACLFYKAGKGKTYPTVEALREAECQHHRGRVRCRKSR